MRDIKNDDGLSVHADSANGTGSFNPPADSIIAHIVNVRNHISKNTMTLSLASAWRPRGELKRFLNHLKQLNQVYSSIAISLPPDADGEIARELQLQNICVVVTRDWSHGRHAALQKASETNAEHIHYCDFDRLLHWVETRPDEWREAVAKIPATDCLIVGRTERAYRTHPLALVQTEAISNAVASHLLGRTMDVSAGSKAFSRRAAEYLMKHSPPGHALGTDSEWTLLLQRAGFRIDYIEADGLEWESADHFSDQVADENAQQRAAEVYDADPKHWAQRVQVAMEIVEMALATEAHKSTQK